MNRKLKILIVTWTWYRFGGDWTYVDNLKKLYESHGHEVIPFSMESPKNIDANGFEKYFVEFIDYKELNKDKSIVNGLKAVSRTILSKEAKSKMEQLLIDYEIDIAHLQNIHHYITPSILPVLKKYKIPIIWTLHDYTIICPENSFISNDKICEKCKGGRFYHCAIQRCKKRSFLASSLAALENYVHRYLHLFKHVDYFLCPSGFLYDKFREFNFHPEKLVLTNLCFEFEPDPETRVADDFILFVGRLEKNKGIFTLLEAMEGTNIKLRIAGDGGAAPAIRKYIQEKGLNNIELLGHLSKDEIHKVHRKAKMLVCPSEWYENFPFSIIEAMALKTPVIGAAIGGIPELVVHEETGLLFEPFNVIQLRENIIRLYNDDNLQAFLANNAQARTESIVSFQRHYSILKDVYAKVGLDL